MPQFHDGNDVVFEMAKYPNRVYVGLTEQTDPDWLMMIRHVYKNIVHSWDIPEEMEEELMTKMNKRSLPMHNVIVCTRIVHMLHLVDLQITYS